MPWPKGRPQPESTKKKTAAAARLRAIWDGPRMHAQLIVARTASVRVRRGVPLTEEHKRHIGAKSRGSTGEHLRRFQALGHAANRGRIQPDEERQRRSKSARGRRLGQESRAKIAASLRGHGVTEKTRQKMSASAAARIKRWVGRYDFVDASGRTHRMRSDWERQIATQLDQLNLTWQYEPCVLHLSTGRSYTPDFFVDEWKCFLEVKGWSGYGGGVKKVQAARRDGHRVALVTRVPMTQSFIGLVSQAPADIIRVNGSFSGLTCSVD